MISYCRNNNIEISDPTYVPGYEPKEELRVFDIVKWEPCEPRYIETKSGQMKFMTEYCYSIGTLIWDYKQEQFYLKSIGTRWLEAAPSKDTCNMILSFIKEKTKEYNQENY